MSLTYGEHRAVNGLQSIFNSQWKNGMLPQIRFVSGQKGYSPDAGEWGITREISGAAMDTSGITQPPNPGFALWRIYENSKNKKELVPFLMKFYSHLKRYHKFLLTERDPDSEGLAAIFHPWASGSDNSPCYDELIERTRQALPDYEQRIMKRKDILRVIAEYRPGEKDYEAYGKLIGFYLEQNYDQGAIYRKCPFVVQDVMFNSMLVESIRSLARIAEVLSVEDSNFFGEMKENEKTAERVAAAIRKKLYDEETGLFYNYDVRRQRLLKEKTMHCLIPLFGRVARNEQAQKMIEIMKKDYWPSTPVPTTALTSSKYDSRKYWRGPVWPVINWMLIRGLENYDEKLAMELKTKTIEMIEEGFGDGRAIAADLLEHTSYGEEFTTPSKKQYHHGWLWDSGFVAIGWPNVLKKGNPAAWAKIGNRKEKILAKGVPRAEVRMKLREEFKRPLFDEYYLAADDKGRKAGDPLGSEMMSWTAAVYLDLKG